MALGRHLSLRGLCVLLLSTVVGGQGKSCPCPGSTAGSGCLDEGKGVWSCGAAVLVFFTKKEALWLRILVRLLWGVHWS